MKSIMACEKDWLHNFCHDNPSRLIFHSPVTAKYSPGLDCGTNAVQTLSFKIADGYKVNT